MNFLRSVSSIGGLTILNRLTGYGRDLLMAHFLGVGALSDAMAFALRFPSLFRRLFAEGAFHSSFLPLYTKFKNDPLFSGMILSLLIMMLGTLVALVEFQFPALSAFFGGNAKPNTLVLSIQLGRITFPYVFFISIASFFGSILNAHGRFSMYAASHAIGNSFVIISILFFSFYSQNNGAIYAWSIVVSGIIQCICLVLTCLYYGYDVRPRWPGWPLSTNVKQFFGKFGPSLLGVGTVQVNVMISLYLASHLPKGGFSYLHYADRFNTLPYSIVGISLSSILLPMLAKQLRDGDLLKANKTQGYAFRFAAFTTMPATMFLCTIAVPLMFVLFGHGTRITELQVLEIAKTVTIFSLALPAHVMTKIINTRFFASGKPKVPFQASLVVITIDVALSLLLLRSLEHLGLACAMTLGAWGGVAFLVFRLFQEEARVFSKPLRRFLRRAASACIQTGGILVGIQLLLPPFPSFSFWSQLGLLLCFLAGGIGLLLSLFSYYKILSKRQRAVLWRSFKKNDSNTEIL